MDQPLTEHTITGDFSDDEATSALHSELESTSNLIQSHLNLLKTWYKELEIKLTSPSPFIAPLHSDQGTVLL